MTSFKQNATKTGSDEPEGVNYIYKTKSLPPEFYNRFFSKIQRDNVGEIAKISDYDKVEFYKTLKGIFYDGGYFLQLEKEILPYNYINEINKQSHVTDSKYSLIDNTKRIESIKLRNSEFFDNILSNIKMGELLTHQHILNGKIHKTSDSKDDDINSKLSISSDIFSTSSLNETGGLSDVNYASEIPLDFADILSRNMVICDYNFSASQTFTTQYYTCYDMQLNVKNFNDNVHIKSFYFNVTLFEIDKKYDKIFQLSEEFYLVPKNNDKSNKFNTATFIIPKCSCVVAFVKIMRNFSNYRIKDVLKNPDKYQSCENKEIQTIVGFKCINIQNSFRNSKSPGCINDGIYFDPNKDEMSNILIRIKNFAKQNYLGTKKFRNTNPSKVKHIKSDPGERVVSSNFSHVSFIESESNDSSKRINIEYFSFDSNINERKFNAKSLSEIFFEPQLFSTPFYLYRIPRDNSMYVKPLSLNLNTSWIKTPIVKVYCFCMKFQRKINLLVDQKNPNKCLSEVFLTANFKNQSFFFNEQLNILLDVTKKFSTFLVFEISDYKYYKNDESKKLYTWIPFWNQSKGILGGKRTLYFTDYPIQNFNKQELSWFENTENIYENNEHLKLNKKNSIELEFEIFSNVHSSNQYIDNAFALIDYTQTDVFIRTKIFANEIYKFIDDTDGNKHDFNIDFIVVIDYIFNQLSLPSLKNDFKYSTLLLTLLIEFINAVFGSIEDNYKNIQPLLSYIQIFSLSNMKSKSSSIFEKFLFKSSNNSSDKRISYLGSETSLFEIINRVYQLLFDQDLYSIQLGWMQKDLKIERKIGQIQSSAKTVKWFFNFLIIKFGMITKFNVDVDKSLNIMVINFLISKDEMFRGADFYKSKNLNHLSGLITQAWILFGPECALEGMLAIVDTLKSDKFENKAMLLNLLCPFLSSNISINFFKSNDVDSPVAIKYFELINIVTNILVLNMEKEKHLDNENLGFCFLKSFLMMIDYFEPKTYQCRSKLSQIIKPLMENYIAKNKNNIYDNSIMNICFVCYLRLDPSVCIEKDSVYGPKSASFIHFLNIIFNSYNHKNKHRINDDFASSTSNKLKQMQRQIMYSSINMIDSQNLPSNNNSINLVNRNVQRILLGTINFILSNGLANSILIRKEIVKFIVKFQAKIIPSTGDEKCIEDSDLHMDLLFLWYKLGVDSILSENEEQYSTSLFNSDMFKLLMHSLCSQNLALRKVAILILLQLLSSKHVSCHLEDKIHIAFLCSIVNYIENNADVFDFQYFIGSLKCLKSIFQFQEFYSVEIFIERCIEISVNLFWILKSEFSNEYKIFLLEYLQQRFTRYLEVRLYLLELIKKYNNNTGRNFAESGMCCLHMAAIIAEYLNIKRNNRFLNVCASDMVQISHNLSKEGVYSSWAISLQPLYCDKRKRIFSIKNLTELLEEASKNFQIFSMNVIYYKVIHLLKAIHMQTGNYSAISTKNDYSASEQSEIFYSLSNFHKVSVSLKNDPSFKFSYIHRHTDISKLMEQAKNDVHHLTKVPYENIIINIEILTENQMMHQKLIYSTKEDAAIMKKNFHLILKGKNNKKQNEILNVTSNYIFPYISAIVNIQKNIKTKFEFSSIFMILASKKCFLETLKELNLRNNDPYRLDEKVTEEFKSLLYETNILTDCDEAFKSITNNDTKFLVIAKLNEIFHIYHDLYIKVKSDQEICKKALNNIANFISDNLNECSKKI